MTNAAFAIFYNLGSGLINAMFSLVAWFLHNIVVAPASIPDNIRGIYDQAVYISTSLIAASSTYAFLKMSFQGLTGENDTLKDLVGRTILAVILSQSSWYIFMDILVVLNNDIVSGIMMNFANIDPSVVGGWALPAIGIIASLSTSMGSLMLILLLGILFVIGAIISVIVWLKRSGELIILIILAPIAASFTAISKQVNSWRWLVQEMISVIFSQSITALFIYTAIYVMTGAGQNSGKDIWDPKFVTNPTMSIVNFALGVTLLFMSFKAHSWIKAMASGYSVTSDHGMLAAGMGAMIGRGVGANFIPPNLQLAAKQVAGQFGMGEFSKGGRALAVAKQANSALGMLENQNVISQIAEAGALSSTASMMNPYTNKAMNQANVVKEITQNQDPQVLAARGITKSASIDFMKAARNVSKVDIGSLDQGLNDLADIYHNLGYERENQSSSNGSYQDNVPDHSLVKAGNRSVDNPYIRKGRT